MRSARSAVLLALVALWWAASHGGWVSRVFLPTPEATLAQPARRPGTAANWPAFTLRHRAGAWSIGWLLASLLGVALGALIGMLGDGARLDLQPTLEFVRPLPASAVLPLAISLFGLSPAWCCPWWPSARCGRCCWPRCTAWRRCEPRLREVARCLQLSPRRLRLQDRPAQRAARHPGRHAPVADGVADRRGGRRDDRLAARPGPGHPAGGARRSAPASCSPASCCWALIGFVSNALLALAERRLLKWQRP